jgi:hypothetical protein
MAERRGISVNKLIQGLLRAELKTYSEVQSRSDLSSPDLSAFQQLGFVPKTDPMIDKNRIREIDAPTRASVRNTEHGISDDIK